MPNPDRTDLRFAAPDRLDHPCVAILIPCLDEEKTVERVVRDFRKQLPDAMVFVYDNGSKDETAQVARQAGATVIGEKRRGKGIVVQSMFQQIDADIFVLVDGDNTYPADKVHDLLAPILTQQADMVVGSRMTEESQSKFRLPNRLGNELYLVLVNLIFSTHLTDILSGYRAMNRQIVKGLPLFLTGFEVETELTIKALERGFRIAEVPVTLRSRCEGSRSKIRILSDGMRILWTILALFRDYKPLTFFGGVGLTLVIVGLLLGLIPVDEFLRTGLVMHYPTAILAVGVVLSGMLSTTVGLVLHTINRRFRELEYYTRVLLNKDR